MKYEEELSVQMERMENLKSKLSERQEYHKMMKKTQLKQSLSKLDLRVEEETKSRFELQNHLDKLRDNESKMSLVEDTLEGALKKFETDEQLETIAVLLLKAEQIRKHRESIEEASVFRKIEIEAIKEESDRRKESHRVSVEKIFQKLEFLQKELPECEETVDEITSDIFGNTNEQCALLQNQVSSVRQMKWEEKVQIFESQVAELCDERKKLSEEQSKTAQRRKNLEKIASKGLEYLIEIELGNGPPLEYLLANMEQQSEVEFDQLSDLNWDNFFASVETELLNGPKKLQEITNDIDWLRREKDWAEKDTLLSPDQLDDYVCEPELLTFSFEEMKVVTISIVDDILAVDGYFNRESIKKQAQDDFLRWNASKEEMEIQMEQTAHDTAVRMVTMDVVESATTSLVKSILNELKLAVSLGRDITVKIIVDALVGLSSEELRGKLRKVLLEMQTARNRYLESNKSHSTIVPTIHGIKLTQPVLPTDVSAFERTNAAYRQAALESIRGIIEEQQKAKEKHEEARALKRMGAKSQSIIILPPKSEVVDHDVDILQCGLIETVNKFDARQNDLHFAKAETMFWNNITFREKYFQIPQRKHGTPNVIAMNSNFLAIGTGLGSVLIYDMSCTPDPVLRFHTHFLSPVLDLCWNSGVGSMVAVCYESGVVHVFELPLSKPLHLSDILSGKHATLISPMLHLTWKDFARKQQESYMEELVTTSDIAPKPSKKKRRKNDIEVDLTPVKVGFHSSCTFSGVPTAILIGLKGGLIVKWNLFKDQDRSVFGCVHATTEPENPQMTSFVPGKGRENGQLWGSTIRREFFQEHSDAPTHFAFANHISELMFSVDESNMLMLWPYTPMRFSGFGWYQPSDKFKLDIAEVGFTTDKTIKSLILFPPDFITAPTAEEEPTPEFLQLSLDEENKLQAINLHPHPWMKKELSGNQTLEIFAPIVEGDIYDSQKHQVLVRSCEGVLLQRLETYFIPERVTGKLVDIQQSTSGRELFFLVMYPPGTLYELKLFIFDTEILQMESIAFSFEASRVSELPVSPRMVISPFMKELQSDYVYILMGNLIHVLSLTTGSYMMKPLAPLKSDVKPDFSLAKLAISYDHMYLVAVGPNDDTIYLFQIENENSTLPRTGNNVTEKPRAKYYTAECQI